MEASLLPRTRPALPRSRINGRMVATFDRDMLERICYKIAEGKPLKRILAENERSISLTTLFQWMDRYPEAAEMVAKARILRSYSYEDEMMEEIADLSAGRVEKDQIRAKDVALTNRRWLMGKWNAPVYSDKLMPQAAMQVVINTDLFSQDKVLETREFTVVAPAPEEKSDA